MYKRLRDEQRIEIVKKYKTGEYSQEQLAKEYNVKQPSIAYLIKSRREYNGEK